MWREHAAVSKDSPHSQILAMPLSSRLFVVGNNSASQEGNDIPREHFHLQGACNETRSAPAQTRDEISSE